MSVMPSSISYDMLNTLSSTSLCTLSSDRLYKSFLYTPGGNSSNSQSEYDWDSESESESESDSDSDLSTRFNIFY